MLLLLGVCLGRRRGRVPPRRSGSPLRVFLLKMPVDLLGGPDDDLPAFAVDEDPVLS